MSFIQARDASRAFYPDLEPTSQAPRQWVMRGGNFVVAYAEAQIGDALARAGADEYMVLLPTAAASIEWNGERVAAPARSITIVPPGPSRVVAEQGGEIVRIFTNREEIAGQSINADTYADGAPELASAKPWPGPEGGWALKCYRLDDYMDRKMRLFRSPNLMVNVFDVMGPRDTKALTPHSHADFEQGSLALAGEWMHSLRYPWSADLDHWRDDEHWAVGSPSLLVIPATVIHTSRATGRGKGQLVDIFCPPRRDFCNMGLVCNAADFPMPDTA